jgi:hypothetical protein
MRTFSRPLWALRNALAPAYRLFLRADGRIHLRQDRHRAALASYPRSGNTWMRDLIECATDRKTGSIYLFDPVNAGRPRSSGIVIKTHETDSHLYGRAIFLVRNPFDAIHSFYKYRRDIEGFSHLTWEKHLPWAVRKWRRHTEHWLNADCPTITLRYEDIKESPAESLRAALRCLDLQVDQQTIDQAVEQCQLQQLRQRYRKDLGHRAEQFFRKGATGTGREAFTAAQAAYVERELGNLMRTLGYPLNDEASPKQRPTDAPLVSIVTPTLNHCTHLRQAIDSVLEQDWPAIELIVMDGGSTDDTVELLKSYGDRITWFSEPDEGQSDAINKGIARSNGSIVTWLNADDTLLPGAVRAAVETFAEHPQAGLIYGDAEFVDAAGRYICDCAHVEPFNLNKLIHYGDFIVQPASFFTREAFDDVGGLEQSLNWGMDWDLFIRIGRRFDVEYTPKKLAQYRWLGESKTATGGSGRLDEATKIGRRYGAKGRPAYFRLEAAKMHACGAIESLRRFRIDRTVIETYRVAREIFTSPRTMGCLLRPHVWHTARVACRLIRAAREDERRRQQAGAAQPPR